MRIMTLQDGAADFDSDVAMAQATVDGLKDDAADNKQDIIDLRDDIGDLQDVLDDVDELKSDISQLQDDEEANADAIEDLQTCVGTVVTTRMLQGGMEKDIATIVQENKDCLDDLKSDLDSLDEDLSQISSDIAQGEIDDQANEDDISDLENDFYDDLKAFLEGSDCDDKIDEQKQKIKDLESDVDEADTAIQLEKFEIADLGSDLDEKESDNEENKSDIDDLEAAVSVLEGENEDNASAISDLENDVATLEGQQIVTDYFEINENAFTVPNNQECYDTFTVAADQIIDLFANVSLDPELDFASNKPRLVLTLQKDSVRVARSLDTRGEELSDTYESTNTLSLVYKEKVDANATF